MAILDGSGTDVSGNASHIANLNPYRYRSYRWDAEIGLYYLQSRYYEPTWGRFLNADGTTLDVSVGLLGHNMYLYCGNNPTNLCDPTGKDAVAAQLYLQRNPFPVGPGMDAQIKKWKAGYDAALAAPGTSATKTTTTTTSTTSKILTQSTTVSCPTTIVVSVTSLSNGWFARIDNPGSPGQQHIHIYRPGDKNSYSQNIDGSPHDKNKNNKNDPSSKMKRDLKEKTGWDWDSNKFQPIIDYDYGDIPVIIPAPSFNPGFIFAF